MVRKEQSIKAISCTRNIQGPHMDLSHPDVLSGTITGMDRGIGSHWQLEFEDAAVRELFSPGFDWPIEELRNVDEDLLLKALFGIISRARRQGIGPRRVTQEDMRRSLAREDCHYL